jgi:arginase
MKKIHLIKNRSELGAGTRGASLGIEAMEVAAINAESDFFNRYDSHDIEVYNNAIYAKENTPEALNIESIVKVYRNTAEKVKSLINSGDFPLVLAGDHASAGGTIAGVKMAHPEKTIGVVWVDAHGDLHSPYTSPSGNVHGMPLATALAYDNQENKIREVGAKAEEFWKDLKTIGGIEPKLKPEHLIMFGVRDTEEPEIALMDQLGIKNYTVAEMRYRGFNQCLEEARQRLENCDVIYISFDVDSMDCDLISKGTGTPVSKGFDQNEVERIMNSFIETGKVACLEVVEVNPTLDEKQNKMAETAFSVLEKLTKTIEKQLD